MFFFQSNIFIIDVRVCHHMYLLWKSIFSIVGRVYRKTGMGWLWEGALDWEVENAIKIFLEIPLRNNDTLNLLVSFNSEYKNKELAFLVFWLSVLNSKILLFNRGVLWNTLFLECSHWSISCPWCGLRIWAWLQVNKWTTTVIFSGAIRKQFSNFLIKVELVDCLLGIAKF